jgi:uncharacterized protein YjiK
VIAAGVFGGFLSADGSTSPSALAGYAIAKGGDARWDLPEALREISGLAATPDGRLFAHGDERALIVELDVGSQRVKKTFTLGRQPVRDDFEGLAISDERFWLVTSNGILYESAEGANGGFVSFRTHDTGVGALCEVEGLTVDPRANALLIACKEPRAKALRGMIAIFTWSIPRRALVNRMGVRVRANLVARATGVATFHPSGIERDSTTGNWLLIAGRERAIVELAPDGRIIAGAALMRRGHRQPEGIAIVRDRTLFIADEAAGGRPTLTTYRYAR